MGAPAKVFLVALLLLPPSCSGVTLRASRSRQLPGAEESCHDVAEGEWCYQAIMWLKSEGMHKHPDWYPSLSASSPLSEFQAELHRQGKTGCAMPCAIEQKRPAAPPESKDCHEAKEETDPCLVASAWAKGAGVKSHPEWYPGLSAESSVAEFHMHLFLQNKSQCPKPPCSTESTKDTLERVWEAHGCNAAERCKRKLPPAAMTVEQIARFLNGWDGYLMATAQEQREWEQGDAKAQAESAASAEPRSAEDPPASAVGAAAVADAQVVSTTAVASGAADMLPKVENVEAANATAAETKRAADVASEAPADMVAQPAPSQSEARVAKRKLVSDEALPVVDQDAKPPEAAEAGAKEEATDQRPQEAAEAGVRNATTDENLQEASPKSGAHEEATREGPQEAAREKPQDAAAASSREQAAEVKPQEASSNWASAEAATPGTTTVESQVANATDTTQVADSAEQAQAASAAAEEATAGGAVVKPVPAPARANLAKQLLASDEPLPLVDQELVSDEALPVVDQDAKLQEAAEAGARSATTDESPPQASPESRAHEDATREEPQEAAREELQDAAAASSREQAADVKPQDASRISASEEAATAGATTVESQVANATDTTQVADSAEQAQAASAAAEEAPAGGAVVKPMPDPARANLAKQELASDEPLPLVDQDAADAGADAIAADETAQDGSKEAAGESPEAAGSAAQPLAAGGAQAPASAVTSSPTADAQARGDVGVTAVGAIGVQAADSAEEVASTTAGGARVVADSTATKPGPEHGVANFAKEELVSDEPLPPVDQDAFEVGAVIKGTEAAPQPATTAATPAQ